MEEKFKKNMKFVPVEKVTQPRSGVFRVITDAYWSVVEHDGKECVMFYRGYSPQCNTQLSIVENINGRLYPEAKITQLPVAYVPCED